jgi:phosphoribosyl-ATP pyrophosphohydrolase/phosphoribosyl-AMP cyclohydrolase
MKVEELAWSADGLLPVVIQDARDGAVLTVAHANREALERTLAERSTYLYSRSRRALWKKGETSGNTQQVVGVDYDCDADALLYRVIPSGPACHTGTTSCFSERLLAGEPRPDSQSGVRAEAGAFDRALAHLQTTIAARRDAAPETSYTAKLLRGGVDLIGKKIGEEATELVIAAKNGSRDEIRWETADLLYHTLVLLAERGVSLDEVGEELLRRVK